MNTLDWWALACYAAGAVVAVVGIVDTFRAAIEDRAAVRRIEKGLGATSARPIEQTPAFTHGQIDQAVRVLGATLARGARWKRPMSLLIVAVIVELSGNLLSLPW